MSTVTLEEAAGVALGDVIGEAENLRNACLVLFDEEDQRVHEKALSELALGLAASPGGALPYAAPPLPFRLKSNRWGSAP